MTSNSSNVKELQTQKKARKPLIQRLKTQVENIKSTLRTPFGENQGNMVSGLLKKQRFDYI